MKESQIARRLKELAQWSDERKAAFVGVSVTKWKVMLRDERRQLLRRAVRKEK